MKIFYSILPFLTAAVLGLSSMPCGSLRAQSMESIDSVLAAVERNNLQLRALQQNNEASRLEIQAQNNLQQDLSVSYSPFFTRGYDGVASSELVVSMGFDFRAGTSSCRPSSCASTSSGSIRKKCCWIRG